MIIRSKKIALILALLLVVSMGSVGCGDKGKKASNDKKTESNKKTNKDDEDGQGLTVVEDGDANESEDVIDFSELEGVEEENSKKDTSDDKKTDKGKDKDKDKNSTDKKSEDKNSSDSNSSDSNSSDTGSSDAGSSDSGSNDKKDENVDKDTPAYGKFF